LTHAFTLDEQLSDIASTVATLLLHYSLLIVPFDGLGVLIDIYSVVLLLSYIYALHALRTPTVYGSHGLVSAAYSVTVSLAAMIESKPLQAWTNTHAVYKCVQRRSYHLFSFHILLRPD